MEEKFESYNRKNAKISIGSKEYRLNALKYKSNDDKLDLMREWFFDNYADPIDLPYNGREGGYQYIHGGPYDASDVLFSTFSGYIEDRFIQELVDDLNEQSYEWGANPDNSDWYYDQFDDIINPDDSGFDLVAKSLRSFNESISHIKDMLEIPIKPEKERYLLGMLQVNTITAMETYLAESFISSLEIDQKFMFNFLSNSKEYQKETMHLSRLFDSVSAVENHIVAVKKRVKESLVDKSWHNISDIVVPLYKITYGIELPRDIGPIYVAVSQRHDWVHRNGKNKEGELLEISKATINELITKIEELVMFVDVSLKALIPDDDKFDVADEDPGF
ncbi:TPA: hypothetical protein ACUNCG_000773 [Aeromonas hydrophila]